MLRHFIQVFKIVWGIRENQVVCSMLLFKKLENIPLDHPETLHVQVLGHLLDKPGLFEVFFHGRDVSAAPRSHLETDSPRAGKQIQKPGAFKINQVVQDIKQAFPGQVGGRAGFQLLGWPDRPSPVFSGYDSQEYR